MSQALLVHSFGVCERHSEGWFAEPLNLLTNAGFIGVAIALFCYYHRHSDLKGLKIYDIHALTFLIFCIGVSSSIFHMFPTPTTELIDMVSIILFINLFFLSTMVRIIKCKWMETLVCFVAFGGFTNILVTHFPNALNDSIAYLSTMTTLIVIALYLNLKRRATARMFLVAALIGVVSLFFRSIDKAVCEQIPFGTHFLWHSFNALLIYILMIQLIRNVNRRARMLRDANQYFA
jgi:Ceramidase